MQLRSNMGHHFMNLLFEDKWKKQQKNWWYNRLNQTQQSVVRENRNYKKNLLHGVSLG